MMRHLIWSDRLQMYMNECKMQENDPHRYSLYLHGYLIPRLEEQRVAGKLRHTKYCKITKEFLNFCLEMSDMGEYDGEVDENNEAFG